MATLIDPDVIDPESSVGRHGARSPTPHYWHRCWRHIHLYWCRLFYWLHRFNEHDSVCLRCYAYHHLPLKDCHRDSCRVTTNDSGRPHA